MYHESAQGVDERIINTHSSSSSSSSYYYYYYSILQRPRRFRLASQVTNQSWLAELPVSVTRQTAYSEIINLFFSSFFLSSISSSFFFDVFLCISMDNTLLRLS